MLIKCATAQLQRVSVRANAVSKYQLGTGRAQGPFTIGNRLGHQKNLLLDVFRLCKNATQVDIYCGLNLKNDSTTFVLIGSYLKQGKIVEEIVREVKNGTRNVFDEDKAAIERGWRPERNKSVVAMQPLQNM